MALNQQRQGTRLIILLIYLGILIMANYFAFGKVLPLSGAKGLWFYSGLANVLLGSLLLTPFFTKPVDAICYSIIAVTAIYLVNDWQAWGIIDRILFTFAVIYFVVVMIFCIIAIVIKDRFSERAQKVSNTFRVLSDYFGNHDAIFGVVIIFALIVFHRYSAREMFIVTLSWAITVFIRPDKILFEVWERIRKIWKPRLSLNFIGPIAAFQTPGIILIRQEESRNINFGELMAFKDSYSPVKVCVALNYTGREEALLLRALDQEVTDELLSILPGLLRNIPKNVVVSLNNLIERIEIKQIKDDINLDDLVGIVAPDTSIERLYFEVIQEKDIEEGSLVKVRIRENPVIYQVIDGLTKEEIIFQKNTYGFARAKARKIGIWDNETKKFMPAKWIPMINSPVYLETHPDYEPDESSIGHFPGTNYTVSIKNIHDLVTHNTAILGILGVGKSMLSIELVERMIASNIKVICLDLTNQYAKELSDFYDEMSEEENLNEIIKAGKKDEDMWDEVPEQGGSLPNLSQALYKDLETFLGSNGCFLKIYNPSQLIATKQLSEPRSFRVNNNWNRSAPLWNVTPVEITRVITEITLELHQDKMTEKARTCLVFEEAHSLVPEWGSVASEGDKSATNGTARAILQGRKYGLGCLLITQRTANVTKTILNQCNTIFAMRTFDDTGKGFLANYIGSEYADLLPSIRERHAVFFGKASSCENPVLIRLNDQDKFREIFRKAHPPKKPKK